MDKISSYMLFKHTSDIILLHFQRTCLLRANVLLFIFKRGILFTNFDCMNINDMIARPVS